jgi:DNA polymerase
MDVFEIVLTVHDELVAEAPDKPKFSVAIMNKLLTQSCGWDEGLPLAAKGYETYRYRKD